MKTIAIKVLEVINEKSKNVWQLLIAIIVVIFLIFAAVGGMKYLDHKLEQMKNTTVEAIENTLAENQSIHAEIIMDALQTSPEINLNIDGILNDINVDYGFNRSAILIYHNGTTAPSGAPFLKYSMRYEQLNEDKRVVKPQREFTKDLGYEYFAYFAYMLNKDGYYICDDLRSLEKVSKVHATAYEMLGIKSFIYILLTNSKDKPIGVLQMFSYDKEKKFSRNEIMELMMKAQKISGYLTLLYEDR